MFKFQTLVVWQRAMELAEILFQIADSLPQKYQYSFADQLRRAALSVPSNIAEGNGRGTKKDSSHFYMISLGSVYECMNILILLSKREVWKESEAKKRKIYDLSTEVCKMLAVISRTN
jgi:four helix bundle protein